MFCIHSRTYPEDMGDEVRRETIRVVLSLYAVSCTCDTQIYIYIIYIYIYIWTDPIPV